MRSALLEPNAQVGGVDTRAAAPKDPPAQRQASPGRERVAWIDYAKGWSIILVVMMHSTLGVGSAAGGETGWLHAFVAFAKPFRMPDFFMVAGLFAASAIEAPWRRFLDRKVIHFAYFYLVWLLLELAVKAPGLGIASPAAFISEYAWRLFQPFSSMWFIQLLPVLYLATRLVRRLSPLYAIGFAAGLHYVAAAAPAGGRYFMESDLTLSITLNSFMLFWVYFLLGINYRAWWFRLAEASAANLFAAGAGLASWAVMEALATQRGVPEILGLDLPFGVLGAAAVIVASGLVARLPGTAWLALLGRNSLPIYLAFFLPMAATRTLALRLFPEADVGLVAAVVTLAGVVGPMIMVRVAEMMGATFLFRRPDWARLEQGQDQRRITTPSSHASFEKHVEDRFD